jgi:hypothetical protein
MLSFLVVNVPAYLRSLTSERKSIVKVCVLDESTIILFPFYENELMPPHQGAAQGSHRFYDLYWVFELVYDPDCYEWNVLLNDSSCGNVKAVTGATNALEELYCVAGDAILDSSFHITRGDDIGLHREDSLGFKRVANDSKDLGIQASSVSNWYMLTHLKQVEYVNWLIVDHFLAGNASCETNSCTIDQENSSRS